MSDVDYRPGYHFAPARNWMNDPNGLIHHNGVYHLFFQHNPRGDGWANMSWGHASSTDLFHWREHPVALLGTADEQIYSGSVVLDRHGSPGADAGSTPALVAVYTSAYADGRQAQSLASSVDDGTTWTTYAGNPVLDRGSSAFRDPKVFWYEPATGSGHWVMAAVEAEARQILFYRSGDLRTWTQLSVFSQSGRAEPTETQQCWECPDLFPLPVDGSPDAVVWVLVFSVNPDDSGGSTTRYVLGQFDGTSFTSTPGVPPRRLDWGADFYAATSYTDAPDGRRIIVGWMSNWSYAAETPTSGWRGLMSLPRELEMAVVDGTQTLVQRPAREVRALEYGSDQVESGPFTLEGEREFAGTQHLRVDVTFEAVTAQRFGLDVLVGAADRTRISYDTAAEELSIDRSRSGNTAFHPSFASVERASVPLINGRLRLEVFVDRISVEVFAQDGTVCLSDLVFPLASSTRLRVVSLAGATRVVSLRYVSLHTPGSSRTVATGRSADTSPPGCG